MFFNVERHRNMITYIKYLVLLSFVDLASQTAVSQSVLDDVLVGLGTWLLVQFGSCGKKTKVQKINCHIAYTGCVKVVHVQVCFIPVYSALEGVDEVVESFSQSFSPFRLPVDGQEEKPSAESGLDTITYKPTNDTQT